jgi:hypothetical protein
MGQGEIAMKKQVGLLLLVVVIAGLLAFAAGSDVAQADSHIVPPDGTYEGKTYGEWAAEWWQWAFAIQANAEHPLNDDYKVDCSLDQDGEIWFLAGATGNWPDGHMSAKRECKKPIPAGKALFFPIVNIVCTTYEDGTTPEEILGCADFVAGLQHPFSVTIDGEVVEDLEQYLTKSPAFSFETPRNPPVLYGFPNDDEALGATSGYYVLLSPLPAGEHDIRFRGWIYFPPYGVDWTVDVSYEFTVAEDS